MRALFFLMLIFGVSSSTVFGQSTAKEIHSREQLWFGYFNQGRITNRLGYWVDIHYRQTDNFVERPFQFIVRPALTYFIKDNLRVNVGYAFVNHFPAEGLETSRPEHRMWQQVWWNQKYTGFNTVQWLRLEERFNRKISNDELMEGYNFNYRLRYNMSFFIPLKGKELSAGTPFLAVMDEIFLNFGKRIVYNTFDQNRFFGGLGYMFTSHLNVQLGYMHVFQQESTGDKYWSTHAIRLFVFHTMDFRKKVRANEVASCLGTWLPSYLVTARRWFFSISQNISPDLCRSALKLRY